MRWALPWLSRMGISAEDGVRVVAMLLVAVVVALLVIPYSQIPDVELLQGQVAPRTVTAPYAFPHLDLAARQGAEEEARVSVRPVFVYQGDLVGAQQERVSRAFAEARGLILSIPSDGGEGAQQVGVEAQQELVRSFRAALGVHVPGRDVEVLLEVGFPDEAEQLARELIQRTLRDYIVADRELLPRDRDAVQVIELRGGDREELTLRDLNRVRTPEEARQQVSLLVLELGAPQVPWVDTAATLARASVRPNLSYDPLETERRRAVAAAAVPLAPVTVSKGTTLFRAGDELTEQSIARFRSMVAARPETGIWVELAAVILFVALLQTILFHFGSNYLPDFSTSRRDVVTVAVLVVLLAGVMRLTVALAPFIAEQLGPETDPSALWYIVPVAGWAILIRLLIGQSWATAFVVFASSIAGLMMGLDALPVVFFLLTGLVASGIVDNTRERMAVVRAGLLVAAVSAATALILHFLGIYLLDPGAEAVARVRPLWSMTFAFAGGILSIPVVLALIPALETFGFVTDYRLMELASLDHPLLRQLMLRSPGSYHHSVLVGSLAEAGCQAIGANALQARVAAYFHDVGKSLRPRFFIENQRDVSNRHDNLDPHTSARIIISHVTEGLRLAGEHHLPRPIQDNIAMHHGTGLLRYFYQKARENASDPSSVDKADFLYPGPIPSTREAGILMLADKVEAATRTIRQPSAESFRAMIQKIVNSVMADGQFDRCPLTFAEIHTVADTFVEVLLGVYHQRIEYPETAQISRPARPAEADVNEVIDLGRELEVETARLPSCALDADEENTDYEAVEHLPRGR
ncbi:MAG: HDIG domain-containing protein [Deltaproteobacteria bacterium]|nr:HDIG domain-containing protein [Deltaproteobacteria bacterium]